MGINNNGMTAKLNEYGIEIIQNYFVRKPFCQNNKTEISKFMYAFI